MLPKLQRRQHTAVVEGMPSVREACLSRCQQATASSLHCPPACRWQPQARQRAAPVGRSRGLLGGPAPPCCSPRAHSDPPPQFPAAALAAGGIQKPGGDAGGTRHATGSRSKQAALLRDCMQHCRLGCTLPVPMPAASPASAGARCSPRRWRRRGRAPAACWRRPRWWRPPGAAVFLRPRRRQPALQPVSRCPARAQPL